MTSSSLRAGQIVAMALLGFSAPPVAATGTTIRVPADKPTIQAAIDAASNGDTVFVSDGTYKENINFEGKAVTLTSVNGAATTIIDGGGSDCGVKFVTNEGLDSVLAGFTIRNGFGSFFCGFNAGGVWIFNSSPTITNNTIIGNTSCGGAGIGIKFGSPLVQGNVITQNNATLTTCPNGGGGISIVGSSSAQILGNTISNNIVTQGTTGGGIGLFGAGTPTIRGNTITGNSIDTSGGGIGIVNQGNLASTPIITDNLITGNTAAQGGGIWMATSDTTVVNNTVAGNSASIGAQVYVVASPGTQFFNNIFFGLPAQTAVTCDTSFSPQIPTFEFNDAFNPQGITYAGSCGGVTGTNGNISADPVFVNSASDFHLQAGSPAIDAGWNAAPSLAGKDLAGNDRILDGTGRCTARVDMGAYEFARPSSLVLSPASLTFPDQLVGTASSALSSTVTNNGATGATVCTVTVPDDFVAQTNTCVSSIASKGSCSVSIAFLPSARGLHSGLLQIVTNDAGSPQSIVLSGKGIAPVVSLSVSALNFPLQEVGATSAVQKVTLSNTGDVPFTIGFVELIGDFSESNTCGSTVAASTNCVFDVTFTPTTTGNRLGSLTIFDTAPGNPHSVNLSGSADDFSLAVAPNGSTSAVVTAGGIAIYDLQLTAVSGFSMAVTFACSGVPMQATCDISPNSLNPGGSGSSFTAKVTTMAPSLLVPRMQAPRLSPLSIYSLELLVVILLLLRTFHSAAFSGRRGLLSSVGLILFAFIYVAGCNGGSGLKNSGTPKGTYTLAVTGTANNVSHVLKLTLIVN